MTYRYWTTRELETVRRLAPEHNAPHIGKVIGRSTTAINRICERYGIRLPPWGKERLKFDAAQLRAAKDLLARGIEQKTIARGLGMPRGHVNHIHKGRRRAA